ncbi:uncharacterized protein LOC114291824 [Camellia sinensis]|uniref:uncharacterized protein LOC114291824 n=1 Tax=Camellia sinensis TaxID=4442 RepID=UPI0010359D27|nr:uncharacterized protein LOC114291824 [Camellia sinensis]
MQEYWGLDHHVRVIPFLKETLQTTLGPEWIDENNKPLTQTEVDLPHLPLFNTPMKVLLWNCRRTTNPHFRRHFNNLMVDHRPQLVVLTETRVGGSRGAALCLNLGFSKYHIVETHSFAGGIWLLWNDLEIHCDIIAQTQHEVHAWIQVSSIPSPWLFSAIYASPTFNSRRLLWENLTFLADSHNTRWLIMGDFNELLTSVDKFGGRPINLSRALKFKECMDHCGMLDLGFSGPKFTWTNLRNTGALIRERLDRAWNNHDWQLLFPETKILHLPCIHSDHCPILLNTHPLPSNNVNRPFRFETIWFSDPSLFSVVRDSWAQYPSSFLRSVATFTSKVSIWNKTCFGNIFLKKRRLERRLLGVQKALDHQSYPFLLELEIALTSELNHTPKLEEEFWGLKSRVNTILEGDRNSKFFHITTINRRRNNSISALKDTSGIWTYEAPVIKNILV